MIIERETNYLYLSGLLPVRHPRFYRELAEVLEHNKVAFGLLPGTKDIWAVDYMPVQVQADKFVQFKYEPDYLRKSKKYRTTITPVSKICKKIGIRPMVSDLVVDGGNLVKSRNKLIMTDKVFQENPAYSRAEILKKLHELLEVEKIIIIPQEPGDYLGHADGMVRFYGEDTVLVNDYLRGDKVWYVDLQAVLRKAGLELIPIPYNPYSNRNKDEARGYYINFLEMKGFILLPFFGLREDEIAAKRFHELFPKTKIAVIDANEIAEQDGVFHCISWNIKKAR
jgi:agmatine deiminase